MEESEALFRPAPPLPMEIWTVISSLQHERLGEDQLHMPRHARCAAKPPQLDAQRDGGFRLAGQALEPVKRRVLKSSGCQSNRNCRCFECRRRQSRTMDEWAPWLALFLQQAGQIEKLSLILTSFTIPLSKSLKHLVLNVREYIREDAVKSLQQLHMLESLCMMHDGWEDDSDEWVYDLQGSLECGCKLFGNLELANCSALKHVRFEEFLPQAVHVPEDCCVSALCSSFEFCQEFDVSGRLVSEGGVGKWHVKEHVREEHNEFLSAVFLSDLLRRDDVTMIRCLRVDCTDFCSGYTPFVMGGCMQNLRDLDIRSSKDVQIQMIPGLHLHRFHVRATILSLSVPDLADFAAHIQDLYFVFDMTCLTTGSLMDEHLHVKRRVAPEVGGKTEVRYPSGSDWVQPGEDGCQCGACEACLGFEEMFGQG